jgi:hypothetical protein
MYTLDELKRQNNEIIELCDVLCVLLKEPSLYNNSFSNELMERFKEKVWMHLIFEDNTIYSELSLHPDDEFRQIVDEFHQSGRAIKKKFSAFIRNWRKYAESGKQHNVVHSECQDILSMIRERAHYENDKMFPIVEKISAE